MQYFIGSEFRR